MSDDLKDKTSSILKSLESQDVDEDENGDSVYPDNGKDENTNSGKVVNNDNNIDVNTENGKSVKDESGKDENTTNVKEVNTESSNSVNTKNGKDENTNSGKSTSKKLKKTFSLREEEVDMIYEMKIRHKDLNLSQIVGQAIQYLHQNMFN